MTILNENLLNALKGAKPKELKFVASVLNRSMTKGISIYEAAKIEKYQPGTKVTFSDSGGNQHVAIVEKIMTKRIRLFDKTTKAIVNIYPQQLKAYVPKVYATRGETKVASTTTADATRIKRKYTKRAISKVNATPRVKRKYVRKTIQATNAAPRTKRKYVRKASSRVDLSPLLNKYGRKFDTMMQPTQKRKYVRKNIFM